MVFGECASIPSYLSYLSASALAKKAGRTSGDQSVGC